MDILRQIRIEYELTSLKWIKENEVFDSEYGKKRIRIWKDKQLLQWHVKWRDDISRQSGILLDRMIRTKADEAFFVSEKGWVTIHDEIEDHYPFDGKEKEWGRLIGTILSVGLKTSDDCQRFKKNKELSLKNARKNINQIQHSDPMAKLVLERSFFEAKSRLRKAQNLQNRIHPLKLPILTSLTNLSNAKQIFSHLFWVCGDSHPVKGYQQFIYLLEYWYVKNGEKSTMLLLDEINKYFSLKGDQGVLVLSECLLPYEYETVIHELSVAKKEEESTKAMENFFKQWDQSRKLVLLLSHWIEKDQEKVVAK